MSHQVFIVPRRGKRADRSIYVQYDDHGQICQLVANLSVDSSVPRIRIQFKEYVRLLHHYNIPQARLSAEEQQAHRKQSYQRYRERIAKQRAELGKPLIPIPPGHRAPDQAIAQVIELLDQINPQTQKPYTGIEIALLTRLSASSVSRIRHGQRHSRI